MAKRVRSDANWMEDAFVYGEKPINRLFISCLIAPLSSSSASVSFSHPLHGLLSFLLACSPPGSSLHSQSHSPPFQISQGEESGAAGSWNVLFVLLCVSVCMSVTVCVCVSESW